MKSMVYPVIDSRCIQEYIEEDIDVIEQKITELEQLGFGNRDSIIIGLYTLASYGYSVLNMTCHQLHMAAYEISWYCRVEHKVSYETMDIINRGE